MNLPVSDRIRLGCLAGCLLLLCACSPKIDTLMAQSALLQQLQADSAPIIVDVRSIAEYSSAHLPGAIHVPFWRAFTSDQLKGVDHKRLLVLYCQHGPRAGIAKLGFMVQGFTNIRYLEGHMAAWMQARLPLERSSSHQSPQLVNGNKP